LAWAFPADAQVLTPPSGADVSLAQGTPLDSGSDAHLHWLRSFVAFNLNIARAFYTHPKVLVVGLNGPAVGLSAALVLIGDSLLGIKRLVRGADDDKLDLQNVHEVFAGLDRFMTGVPQEEFRKLATGEKRHKL
jgi:hypothetical protein